MTKSESDLAHSLVRKAELALKEAVEEVVREHRRLGLPLAVWQDDRVVLLPAEGASVVNDPPATYSPTDPPDRK